MQAIPKANTSLLLIIVLAGCAAEKGEQPKASSAAVQTIERPNMNWGLPFEFRPLRKAEPAVQEAAKAVAFVRYAESGGGTGFFISEDGLFLTNEHVISRDACSASRCAGVQIIRDFRANGDLEVFDTFDVLAHNKDIDVALLRVKLAEGKKVPFLKLSSRDEYSKEDPMLILGHPHNSSLHVSASRLDKEVNPGTTYFRSITMGGNSGSPIVDAKTLEVIAIHNGSSRRDRRVERTGVVHGYGMGILTKNFVKMIQILDPSFSAASPRFSPPTGSTLTARQAEVAPQITISGAMTVEQFAHTAAGTSSEKGALRKLLEALAVKSTAVQDLSSALDSLITLDLNRGKKSAIVAEELKDLLPADWKWPDNARSFYLGAAKEECLKEVETYKNLYDRFSSSATDCYSLTQANGEDAFVLLARIFEAEKGKTWGEDHEKFNNALLFGIEGHLLLRPSLAPDEVALLKKVLVKIGSDTPLVKPYFNADQDLTLLSEKPKLIGPGSFRDL